MGDKGADAVKTQLNRTPAGEKSESYRSNKERENSRKGRERLKTSQGRVRNETNGSLYMVGKWTIRREIWAGFLAS